MRCLLARQFGEIDGLTCDALYYRRDNRKTRAEHSAFTNVLACQCCTACACDSAADHALTEFANARCLGHARRGLRRTARADTAGLHSAADVLHDFASARSNGCQTAAAGLNYAATSRNEWGRRSGLPENFAGGKIVRVRLAINRLPASSVSLTFAALLSAFGQRRDAGLSAEFDQRFDRR